MPTPASPPAASSPVYDAGSQLMGHSMHRATGASPSTVAATAAAQQPQQPGGAGAAAAQGQLQAEGRRGAAGGRGVTVDPQAQRQPRVGAVAAQAALSASGEGGGVSAAAAAAPVKPDGPNCIIIDDHFFYRSPNNRRRRHRSSATAAAAGAAQAGAPQSGTRGPAQRSAGGGKVWKEGVEDGVESGEDDDEDDVGSWLSSGSGDGRDAGEWAAAMAAAAPDGSSRQNGGAGAGVSDTLGGFWYRPAPAAEPADASVGYVGGVAGQSRPSRGNGVIEVPGVQGPGLNDEARAGDIVGGGWLPGTGTSGSAGGGIRVEGGVDAAGLAPGAAETASGTIGADSLPFHVWEDYLGVGMDAGGAGVAAAGVAASRHHHHQHHRRHHHHHQQQDSGRQGGPTCRRHKAAEGGEGGRHGGAGSTGGVGEATPAAVVPSVCVTRVVLKGLSGDSMG